MAFPTSETLCKAKLEAQPLRFGALQWAYETAFTVDGVERTGEFYIVHARVLCPFGERFHWNDRDVVVQTFFGLGGTMLTPLSVTVDENAQTILDRKMHRPGPSHIVLGTSQDGHFWQPHHFNLRYD